MPDELPPLPEDFTVPEGLIDTERQKLDGLLLFDTLLSGKDARPFFWVIVRQSGDDYAVLLVKLLWEPIGGWMLNEATVREAFETSRQLMSLVTTAREVALR